MWPDCSAPRRLPAPLISRSRTAILKPAPSIENCSIACKRFLAVGFKFRFLGSIRVQYALCLYRPTRPLNWCKSESPNRSASAMNIVFAFGISMPDSIIVVETKISASPLTNPSMTCSSSREGICPCPTMTFASGAIPLISAATASMSPTLLWT